MRARTRVISHDAPWRGTQWPVGGRRRGIDRQIQHRKGKWAEARTVATSFP